jgi:hypothetical protein
MAKEKKRMSKNAKAALKLLNDSKLLAAAKTVTDAKADQNFKPAEAPVKPTGANKLRPEKKRG